TAQLPSAAAETLHMCGVTDGVAGGGPDIAADCAPGRPERPSSSRVAAWQRGSCRLHYPRGPERRFGRKPQTISLLLRLRSTAARVAAAARLRAHESWPPRGRQRWRTQTRLAV